MEKVNAKDYLGKKVSIEIDRPLGTRHPKHGFMYMINYGFIPNTVSGDGEELDAYLVGEFYDERIMGCLQFSWQKIRQKSI